VDVDQEFTDQLFDVFTRRHLCKLCEHGCFALGFGFDAGFSAFAVGDVVEQEQPRLGGSTVVEL
jgi:hypothetical protein